MDRGFINSVGRVFWSVQSFLFSSYLLRTNCVGFLDDSVNSVLEFGSVG